MADIWSYGILAVLVITTGVRLYALWKEGDRE